MVIIVSLIAEILQRLQNLNKETKRFLPEVHQTSAIQWSPELLQNIKEKTHAKKDVSEPRMWGKKQCKLLYTLEANTNSPICSVGLTFMSLTISYEGPSH